jgi:hypothetical protein
MEKGILVSRPEAAELTTLLENTFHRSSSGWRTRCRNSATATAFGGGDSVRNGGV